MYKILKGLDGIPFNDLFSFCLIQLQDQMVTNVISILVISTVENISFHNVLLIIGIVYPET